MFDELELWKKICSRDAEAFDTWYRETAPRVLVFLRHLLRNEQAAEDVMQETFTQIWRRPLGFDSERGTLRAYLFGVARKQAAEWSRKRKPADTLAFDPSTRCHIEDCIHLR